MTNQLIGLLPPLFFATGLIAGFVIAIRYNLRTYSLQKKIQQIASSQGEEWKLFGNTKKMTLFVLSPANLIDASDSAEMVEAKKQLLKHRYTLASELIKGCMCLVIGIFCAIAVPMLMAILN